MNSKEKTFIGILAGATVICAGVFFMLAGKSATRTEAAKEKHAALSSEIKKMQNLPLFPTEDNLEGKENELEIYQANAAELATKLQAYRPIAIDSIDPQTFTNTLVKTADATMKTYAAAGMKAEGDKGALPRGFYLGFETYTNTPAQQGATGILAYQLSSISEVHKLLAAAKPAKLLNFMREPLPEEKNIMYEPINGAPYRILPFEISFSGPESSMRDFINGLQSSKSYFYVIRTLRIKNEKLVGPKASDVQFNTKPAKASGGVEGFDAFELPDAAPAPAPGAAEPGAAVPAPEAPAPEAPEPTPVADSDIILKQVLGAENINVFMRVDVLLFDAPADTEP